MQGGEALAKFLGLDANMMDSFSRPKPGSIRLSCYLISEKNSLKSVLQVAGDDQVATRPHRAEGWGVDGPMAIHNHPGCQAPVHTLQVLQDEAAQHIGHSGTSL